MAATPNAYNPGNFQIHTIAAPTEVENIAPGHPVWKVTMTGNHSVIVKAENSMGARSRDAGLVSAAFGVMLMAAVTPGMEAVKLSQNEYRALWDVNQTHVKPQANDHGVAAKALLTDILKTNIDKFIVFKMPFVPNLLALDKAKQTNKTAEFAQHLVDDDYAATVELGKILAVDLFIGNDDRFAENGDLINPGNVLLHKDSHNKWHAIGLDHYSSGGQHSNLATPAPQGWGGTRLNTLSLLVNFAGKIKTALNATGTRQNQPALNLQAKFQDKLAQGLAEGAAMIRSTVQHAEPSTIPDGVKSRFQTLHWDLQAPRNSRTATGTPATADPIQVVNNVMGGNAAPQVPTTGGGRQSPSSTPNTSGGRQSPSTAPTTSGGRQSPSTTTNNNLKRSSK